MVWKISSGQTNYLPSFIEGVFASNYQHHIYSCGRNPYMVEGGDEREIGFGLILDHTLPLVTNALWHAIQMKFCHPYMGFIPFVLFLPSLFSIYS
jgi:hypothetical protein